jgi:RimJ/RimL family protein N-acetyltransferase
VIRLEPAHFPSAAALPLWAGLEIHLAVASVLAGTTPGEVYVEKTAAPGNALLHTGSRFYLAGPPAGVAWGRDLRSFFLDQVYAQRPEPDEGGPGGFGLYYPGPSWQPAVEEILAGTHHTPMRRLYLEIETSRAGPLPALPPGFRLRPVNRELLAEEHLGRLAELRREMTSECPSVEFFLRHRFGVCLEGEGSLAAWCLSEFDVGARCEVGIETAPAHRRRGLGTTLALALAREARARGMARLGWHCYEGNQASVATALRAGFRQVASYPAHAVRYGRHDSQNQT